jgi:hypothetical protein
MYPLLRWQEDMSQQLCVTRALYSRKIMLQRTPLEGRGGGVVSVHGFPLELVRIFLYLGCQLSLADNEWSEVVKNLAKAQNRGVTISRVLDWDVVTPRISAMFYKAVIQSVLTYGSKTWVLPPEINGKLEGFHKQIAHRLFCCTLVYH